MLLLEWGGSETICWQCELWGLNSGCQTWQQVHLPTDHLAWEGILFSYVSCDAGGGHKRASDPL